MPIMITDEAYSHLGGNALEGEPHTYTPSVWRWIVERFAIRTVLDIGSGMGYAADYFYRQGMRVLAVEGLPFNVRNSVYPSIRVDLTQQPVECKVDLVHCQEVVEHIDPIHIGKLLHSLSCGKFLIMTHAFPGQGGHHHVNEQPSEYWIQALANHGLELLPEETKRVRELAKADAAIFMQISGLVFINRGRHEQF
jgi:hypothetical protein